MTPRTVRKAERTVHLFWGALLALYVYGVLPAWGEPLVRWLVVPGIVGSGLAMWFAAPLRRFVRRRPARVALLRRGRQRRESGLEAVDDAGQVLAGRVEFGVVDRDVEPDHAAGGDDSEEELRQLPEVQTGAAG